MILRISVALMAAIAARAAMAQAPLPDLGNAPQCEKTCAQNMVKLASTVNCGASDLRCMCESAEWVNGYQSCAKQSCPEGDFNSTISALNDVICAKKAVASGSSSASSAASSSSRSVGSSSSRPASSSSSRAPSTLITSSTLSSSSTPSSSSRASTATTAALSTRTSQPASSSTPSSSSSASRGSSPASAAGAAASSTTAAATASKSHSGPNLGVILPAVLCSVLGVLIIALLAFFILRRRRKPPPAAAPRLDSKTPAIGGGESGVFQAVSYEEAKTGARPIRGESVGSGGAAVARTPASRTDSAGKRGSIPNGGYRDLSREAAHGGMEDLEKDERVNGAQSPSSAYSASAYGARSPALRP